jgi:hypothetical protein
MAANKTFKQVIGLTRGFHERYSIPWIIKKALLNRELLKYLFD